MSVLLAPAAAAGRELRCAGQLVQALVRKRRVIFTVTLLVLNQPALAKTDVHYATTAWS